jgi:hypothetical protein
LGLIFALQGTRLSSGPDLRDALELFCFLPVSGATHLGRHEPLSPAA